jgi:uncharacterized protein (TIRG00374 family)
MLWFGAGVALVALIAGVSLLIWDRPLELVAGTVERVLVRFDRFRDSCIDLPARVLTERAAMRSALSHQRSSVIVAMVGKSLGDYLALYAALLAAGASPNPVVPLAALAAANLTGMIPITPGGLGFVEAGLTATLAVAGIPPDQALVAAVAYRAVSTWLPVGAGLVAYLGFELRHSRRPAVDADVAVDLVLDEEPVPELALT